MLDPDEVRDLRAQDRHTRRREHAANRDAFAARDAGPEPEPEDEYHSPNQPKCTAKANGEVSARKAITLAQQRKDK